MKFRVVAVRLACCRSLAREALRVLAWPAILCAGLAGTSAALATASPMFWFNLVYLGVVLLILACERILPYERAWQANDGEMREDLAHTLFTKGVAQLGAYLATLAGAASAIALQPAASQAGPWPAQWPMALQVVLGLVVAELGLYVAHRAAHEWRPLWRFHALHHSVRRLWVINTGRFHIVDTLMKIACSQTPLLLLGAPLRVFLWVSAATAFIGLLTHCNIDVRTGFLDRIFSTPPLHRWHHSKRLPEGNRNYGENVVLWDRLFGTYYHPRDRRPPVDIGISGRIHDGFLRQLWQPFSARGARDIMEPAAKAERPAS